MESLGNKLKTTREGKGWTYDYISRETNMSVRYLEALEKEDFSCFPGEPYILGFLRNYGEVLGINQDELLSLYRSHKIQEQPVPVEQLLKSPSPLPKILRGAAVALVLLILAAGITFFISRLPERSTAAPMAPDTPFAVRAAVQYTLSNDFLERRFYPGDSVLITKGAETFQLVFSSLSDVVTITGHRDPIILDLGQEVTVDLNNDGIHLLRIIASDFVRHNSALGALLRFEQDAQVQLAHIPSIPLATLPAGRATTIFSSPRAHPFTLQVAFQNYCLFRYEILFERDRQGRHEHYHQRFDELNILAQNGIRLGISNAQAVRLQVIGGGRTVPFEAGGPGEVVAADLRWVRDEDNTFRLVLMRLD